MENKKSAMAELINEYGFGFDNMEDVKEEPVAQEEAKEESQEAPITEPIVEEPKDITIKCKKCENEFIWTIRDQEFYKEKGFFKPSYCKDCRKKTKVINNFHKDM